MRSPAGVVASRAEQKGRLEKLRSVELETLERSEPELQDAGRARLRGAGVVG